MVVGERRFFTGFLLTHRFYVITLLRLSIIENIRMLTVARYARGLDASFCAVEEMRIISFQVRTFAWDLVCKNQKCLFCSWSVLRGSDQLFCHQLTLNIRLLSFSCCSTIFNYSAFDKFFWKRISNLNKL